VRLHLPDNLAALQRAAFENLWRRFVEFGVLWTGSSPSGNLWWSNSVSAPFVVIDIDVLFRAPERRSAPATGVSADVCVSLTRAAGLNLLVNAVVHAYAEEVRIVAQGDGPDVSLKVSNKGAPISPQIMDSIFEPLMRGGGTPDSLSTGLGLGLFIVKQIVTAHQGTVEVTSTASEGTMFTLRLPRIAD